MPPNFRFLTKIRYELLFAPSERRMTFQSSIPILIQKTWQKMPAMFDRNFLEYFRNKKIFIILKIPSLTRSRSSTIMKIEVSQRMKCRSRQRTIQESWFFNWAVQTRKLRAWLLLRLFSELDNNTWASWLRACLWNRFGNIFIQISQSGYLPERLSEILLAALIIFKHFKDSIFVSLSIRLITQNKATSYPLIFNSNE